MKHFSLKMDGVVNLKTSIKKEYFSCGQLFSWKKKNLLTHFVSLKIVSSKCIGRKKSTVGELMTLLCAIYMLSSTPLLADCGAFRPN